MSWIRGILFFIVLVLAGSCGGGGKGKTVSVSPVVTSVNPPVSLSLSASNLSFSLRQNERLPQSQTASVSWLSSEIVDVTIDLTANATPPDWLSITQTPGSRTLRIELSPNTSNLPPDTYQATLILNARDTARRSLVSERLDVTYVVATSGADKRASRDSILHFGQNIVLNGANIAWSQDSGNWYNREIGDVDENGAPRTNLAAFENHFRTIAAAGGNSARIWLHTGATVTPVIEPDGAVTGLSRDLSDAQVVQQLTAILDAAWREGVLVTFNIFSFNMICDAYQPVAAKRMLESQFQTYIDNALTPMVSGLKDHPAMFAWDVFNEAEGMSRPNYFCPSSETVSTETAQSVVNQTAAAIHQLDPNVKVTTSVHTDIFDQYSNAALTTLPNARLGGILDFYSLHWFDTGWQVSPYITLAGEFGADRPVIMGEYDAEDTGGTGPSGRESLRRILENGYMGGWPWSLSTGNVDLITGAITEASPLSGVLDKAAIEACLQNKPAACYTP